MMGKNFGDTGIHWWMNRIQSDNANETDRRLLQLVADFFNSLNQSDDTTETGRRLLQLLSQFVNELSLSKPVRPSTSSTSATAKKNEVRKKKKGEKKNKKRKEKNKNKSKKNKKKKTRNKNKKNKKKTNNHDDEGQGEVSLIRPYRYPQFNTDGSWLPGSTIWCTNETRERTENLGLTPQLQSWGGPLNRTNDGLNSPTSKALFHSWQNYLPTCPGQFPSVAEAFDRKSEGRTTTYRKFNNQESELHERAAAESDVKLPCLTSLTDEPSLDLTERPDAISTESTVTSHSWSRNHPDWTSETVDGAISSGDAYRETLHALKTQRKHQPNCPPSHDELPNTAELPDDSPELFLAAGTCCTALIIPAQNGDQEVCTLRCDSGAKADQAEENDEIPLYQVAGKSDLDLCHLLVYAVPEVLEVGCPADVADLELPRPVEYSAKRLMTSARVRRLRDLESETPLSEVAGMSDLDFCRLVACLVNSLPETVDVGCQADGMFDGNDLYCPVELALKKGSQSVVATMQTCHVEDLMRYHMRPLPRAQLIIVNNTFSGTEHERHGTGRNRHAMRDVFRAAEYSCNLYYIWKDLSGGDLFQNAMDLVTEEDRDGREVGCRFLTVLSHGQQACIRCADECFTNLSDIFRMLLEAKHLENKPKVVIGQFCRTGPGTPGRRSEHGSPFLREFLLQVLRFSAKREEKKRELLLAAVGFEFLLQTAQNLCISISVLQTLLTLQNLPWKLITALSCFNFALEAELAQKKNRKAHPKPGFPAHLRCVLEAPNWKPAPVQAVVCPAALQVAPPALTDMVQPQLSMNLELTRLATFSSWPMSAVYPGHSMAFLGFYKSGEPGTQEATCFSCHWSNSSWSRDELPLKVHHQQQPDCQLLKLELTSNIPVGEAPDVTAEMGPPPEIEKLVELEEESEEKPRDGYFRSIYEEPLYSLLIELSNEPDHRVELQRLATFTQNNWRRDHPMNPLHLARAGFYYLGTHDRVRCFFCHNTLRDWEDGDIPMDEHLRHFPNCGFISGDQTPNEPWDHKTIDVRQTTLVVNNTTVIASASNVADNGPAHKTLTETFQGSPRHPHMITERARLESFKNWRHEHVQKKKDLAQAGLFHAGHGDLAKCFFCDGGLRNWEPEDQPWIEHARWFPRCEFIRKIKGQDFIENARANRPVNGGFAARQMQSQFHVPMRPNTRSTTYPVDMRQVKARLDGNLCVRLVEWGYSRDVLKDVITRRLRYTGDDFTSAQQLVEAYQERARELQRRRDLNLPDSEPDPEPQQAECGDKEEAEPEDPAVSCRICMDAKASVVFLPCGHLCCCGGCAPNMRVCPICRGNIRGTVVAKQSG